MVPSAPGMSRRITDRRAAPPSEPSPQARSSQSASIPLASGVDADWLDLAWGEGSDGGAARLAVILRDIPGALGTMSGILGQKHANIINLQLVHRDGSFQTFHLDIEVHDLAHLHAIVAALRDAEPVSSVERI